MSDSEDRVSVSDDQIRTALKSAITSIFKAGNHDELTVKRMRAAAESQLGLPAGYLKEGLWKNRSKEFIEAEVTRQDEQQAGDSEERDDVRPIPQSKRSQKPKTKPSIDGKLKSRVKRASPATRQEPRKRRKVVASESEADEEEETSPLSEAGDDSDGEHLEETKPKTDATDPESELPDALGESQLMKNLTKNGPKDPKKTTVNSESELSEVPDEPSPVNNAKKTPPTYSKSAAVDSESELSDVLDEPPAKKKGRNTAHTKATRSEKPAKGARKASKAKDDLDPNDAEIKRLQGWLVKCGIRKMWWKELQPYVTPKAKISHLKGMLKDAGMDGRYSLEKARQIMERREMEADLEAVQEGAKRWGQEESENDSGGHKAGGKLRRGLAKGFKDLDFSDDGIETD
ncbi:hypothetical protein EJ05DRAFT_170437 [Pseudovirgaria hyperparasitica]|uniref:Transcriptional regulator n=1 Tax=Pseudovirgaria hyperparasitica TaxID=470096 RepID=A0A6A6VWV2_9PEZI|nr:uncharacterized protein EJ05DRAFT_170437 [Pseudovirgaria hyperparasitica]KAF2753737.1 hypothetical protein EJ05DRAFT_170437 [Pseudovirgaria hyperparasitica]